MHYTIGQVAKKLDLNIETLYFYDRQGLLSFVKRDQAGRRIFTYDDLEMIMTILHLKNAVIPLKEIKKFIDWRMAGDRTLQERADFIHDQKLALDKKISELVKAQQILEYKEWYYARALKAGTEKVNLVGDGFRYNDEAVKKFSEMVDNMSEIEKELFQAEKANRGEA